MTQETLTAMRLDRLRAYFAERTPDPELVAAFEDAVRQEERARLRAVVADFMEPRGIFAK